MNRTWNEDELRHLYLEERKTLREIGRLYNVSHEAVRLRLVNFGIIPRKRGEACFKKKYKPRDRSHSSLEEFLLNRVANSRWDNLTASIPKYLLPVKVACADCHKNSPFMHYHHIRYPARHVDDFIVLCASCHQARHSKGMTYPRQLDLYRDYLSGTSRQELMVKYNISKSMVDRISKKIRDSALL